MSRVSVVANGYIKVAHVVVARAEQTTKSGSVLFMPQEESLLPRARINNELQLQLHFGRAMPVS